MLRLGRNQEISARFACPARRFSHGVAEMSQPSLNACGIVAESVFFETGASMKKLVLGTLATAALAAFGPANAADLPVKAAPMAPAHVAPANWTGHYVDVG